MTHNVSAVLKTMPEIEMLDKVLTQLLCVAPGHASTDRTYLCRREREKSASWLYVVRLQG